MDFRSCEYWRKNSVCYQLLSRSLLLQSLSFSLSCVRCFENFICTMKTGRSKERGPWSTVRTLTLHIKAFQHLQQTAESENNFKLANLPPSVTSLSLFLPTPSDTPRIVLPLIFSVPRRFKNLTFLHLGCDWGPNVFLYVLRQSPNLQSLRLDGKYFELSTGWRGDATEIVLPRLHTLDVNMRPSGSAAVLPLLSTPALVHVRMGVDHGKEVRENLVHLKVFPPGTPSAPTLQSLTIYSIWLAEDETFRACGSEAGLVDIFFAIPSLQSFTIRGISFSSRLFPEILQKRVDQGDKVFLPNIQSIQLIEPRLHFGSFDVESFLQFVKFRHHLMQPQADLEAARRLDSLRRIAFHFRKSLNHVSEFREQATEWELALDTIDLLEKSYGIIVDRAFFPQ
ncbi:hypothetical protein NMY22_g4939 [Coprinellus aureogranulatus]|nr:hypothetical protein NMY22_g4939 [Coprinellus aureogranulatus]